MIDHVYNDKIWYYKDNIIVDEIPINEKNLRATGAIKNFELKKNYDLHFLDDKLIIKEHIFDDMKTNIED